MPCVSTAMSPTGRASGRHRAEQPTRNRCAMIQLSPIHPRSRPAAGPEEDEPNGRHARQQAHRCRAPERGRTASAMPSRRAASQWGSACCCCSWASSCPTWGLHSPTPHRIPVEVVALAQAAGQIVDKLNGLTGEPLAATATDDEDTAAKGVARAPDRLAVTCSTSGHRRSAAQWPCPAEAPRCRRSPAGVRKR